MKKTTAGSKANASTASTTQPINRKNTNTSDLPDSPRDAARLQGDEATLDLPEVKDIPGQEHVKVPRMREMADVTASSADEEGGTLLDDVNDEDIAADKGNNVSKEEADLLQAAADYTPTEEEERLQEAGLDDTDDDGEPLNEKGSGFSGRDLDVPGSEDDDADEDMGEEDEENNPYSVDADNDDDDYDGK
jgi:hypothetical protein